MSIRDPNEAIALIDYAVMYLRMHGATEARVMAVQPTDGLVVEYHGALWAVHAYPLAPAPAPAA